MDRRGAFLVILVFAAGAAVAWTGLRLPPPLAVVRYGFSPTCAPTGETVVHAGVEFVEIGPGVGRVFADHPPHPDGFLGRLGEPLGLVRRSAARGWRRRQADPDPRWVDFPRGFWIARSVIREAQFREFDPGLTRAELDHRGRVNATGSVAAEYCRWLSERSGEQIQLPKEAEWEVACWADARPPYSIIGFRGVGQPNEWGLEDFGGSHAEQCSDVMNYWFVGQVSASYADSMNLREGPRPEEPACFRPMFVAGERD